LLGPCNPRPLPRWYDPELLRGAVAGIFPEILTKAGAEVAWLEQLGHSGRLGAETGSKSSRHFKPGSRVGWHAFGTSGMPLGHEKPYIYSACIFA
jgi:hypothetical protein